MTDTDQAELLLDGEWMDADTYRYYADETRSYWRADRDAMLDLERRLEADEPDAYSKWCSEIGLDVAEEQP